MARSQAEIVAALSEEDRAELFKDFTEEQYDALQYDWGFWGRPEQSPPDDDSWHIFLALAGRGWGKSRAGAEWIRKKVKDNPGCKIILLGRTASDVRDVMVSAIMEASPPEEKPEWKPSQRRLEWPNGSFALGTSSESPDQLRGPQAHFAWVDELAALKATTDDSGATAWSNLLAATRLGDNPQIFGTTTPKRTQLMKTLVEDHKDPAKRIKIVKGSTFDNTNLSGLYIDAIVGQYGNSDLAKQELYGEMLLDAEGLFFTEQMIKDSTIPFNTLPYLPLRFIAVDPSVAERPRDECGIIAVGMSGERDITKRTAYIIEDYSLRASPDIWAKRVVDAAEEHNTRYVVVEKNQGYQLLQMAINAVDPTLKVFLVHASKGKQKRAEPVVITMQQGRVKLVDNLPDLTDQMLFFDPEEDDKSYSPDRMDAMVWGVTAALIDPPHGLRLPRQKVTTASQHRLPNTIGTGRSRATTSLRRRSMTANPYR